MTSTGSYTISVKSRAMYSQNYFGALRTWPVSVLIVKNAPYQGCASPAITRRAALHSVAGGVTNVSIRGHPWRPTASHHILRNTG